MRGISFHVNSKTGSTPKFKYEKLPSLHKTKHPQDLRCKTIKKKAPFPFPILHITVNPKTVIFDMPFWSSSPIPPPTIFDDETAGLPKCDEYDDYVRGGAADRNVGPSAAARRTQNYGGYFLVRVSRQLFN